jgi:hypothetical protein
VPRPHRRLIRRFAQEGRTVAGTIDVAGNFALFIGYYRCLGEAFGMLET